MKRAAGLAPLRCRIRRKRRDNAMRDTVPKPTRSPLEGSGTVATIARLFEELPPV